MDAWKNEDRREKMKAALADLRHMSNARLDAGICSGALLARGRPAVIEPAWDEAEDGRRDYVDGTGVVLASVTEQDGRWTAS